MTKQKAYYAHSMHLYDTKQEARDILLLGQLGFDVVNPNSEEIQKGLEAYDGPINMMYFEDVVIDCDLLAFRALPGGKIGSGVAQEIQWMLRTGRPVIELPSGLEQRGLTYEQTAEMLRETGQR